MRSTKEFIDKVTKKMGYGVNDYTVIEDSGVYEDMQEDIINALDKGMVFIEGACIAGSNANQLVSIFNSVTWDKDHGVSIIIPFDENEEPIKGINIQGLGVINALLNIIKSHGLKKEPKKVVEQLDAPIENISLKDYYKLNLPNNRIGRKSDETLIKELEEAGFKVG